MRRMGSSFAVAMLAIAVLISAPCMADPGKAGTVMYAASDHSALAPPGIVIEIAAREMLGNKLEILEAIVREPLTGTGLGLTAVNAAVAYAYVAVAPQRQDFL